MKVVIAGGSGLIGSLLSASLVADGHDVVILSRGGDRGVEWHPPAVGPWAAELEGADAVVNLAGASIGRWPWTPARRRLLLNSRLDATHALVQAIEGLPPARRPAVLLSASGTDVYEGEDVTPATEAAPPGSSFLAGLCLAWEREALRAAPLGVRVVLMRTSSVLARGAPYLRVVSLPTRCFVGGPIGGGRQWVSWVAADDVVGLYRWAMETGSVEGPLNVAAPDPRRQADYARALGTALRRPSFVRTPAWVVRLVLGPQASLALGSRRVWPAKALSMGYAFGRPRLEGALLAALGRPVGR